MRVKTIVFSTLVLVLSAPACNAALAGPGDVTTLKRLSQQFSDASRTNDVIVLGKLLDDRVTFMNEDGDLATKHDLVSGPPTPHTPGVTTRLTQRDFVVRLYGGTAVTSFTDRLVQTAYGQVVTQDFRSTEVWLKESAGWKMISSQTMAMQADPPAIRLPSSDLEAYVGTYTPGPGLSITIARGADGLSVSTNGGPPVALKAEVRDVFFTPGHPRLRRIFQRDARGDVIGFVSRHEGHGLRFTRKH